MQQVSEKVNDQEALQRISYWMKYHRGDRSLGEIARGCDTYPTAIKRIEDGGNMPGAGLLTRIAGSLGVEWSDLLQPIPKKRRKSA